VSGFAAVVPVGGGGVDPEVVQRMARLLARRGPDGQRIEMLDGCGLAHSRLLTGDRPQPAQGPFSLDARLHVVCDARLDDRGDLARALRAAGEPADALAPAAEMIARAYRAWGPACVERLVGDFAFALWDAPRRRLFCARDPLGVKPFYHAAAPGAFVCSNTLDCVLLHPGVSAALDELAVADFLVHTAQMDAERTIRRAVRALPPGHRLRVEDGRVHVERYWHLPVDEPLRYRRVGEYADHFEEIFATAVRERTPPGGVGVLMSGGHDSPAVAAMAVAALRGTTADVKAEVETGVRAFTAHSSGLFREEEGRYAAMAAEVLGIPVTWHDVDRYRAFERFGADPRMERPEPVPAPFLAATVDQWLQAAGHARVLLTGYGGDAVLRETPSRLTRLAAGGHLLRAAVEAAQYARHHGRLPRPGVRTWLRRDGAEPTTPIPEWIDPAFARRVDLAGRVAAQASASPASLSSGAPHPLRPEACEMIAGPLWPHLFATHDPGATGIPLEIRYPFFDVRLIRFLLSIPPAQWYNDKGLLRIAMRGRLPAPLLRRPKTPLPQDPVRVRREAHGDAWLGGRTLGPEVEPYVDIARVPAITGGRAPGDGHPLWLNLRPLSLSVWLRQQGAGSEP